MIRVRPKIEFHALEFLKTDLIFGLRISGRSKPPLPRSISAAGRLLAGKIDVLT